MTNSFSGWTTTAKIDDSKLEKDFFMTERGDDEVYYISYNIFHHDLHNQDDGDFEYRIAIRTENLAATIGEGFASVDVLMIPLTDFILNKLQSYGYEYDNEKPLHSFEYAEDAISEGYTISIGREELNFDSDSEEECNKVEKNLHELAVVASNVYEVINSFRGYALDRPVNRLGSQGWDVLNEWVYGGEDYISATLKRYNEQKGGK